MTSDYGDVIEEMREVEAGDRVRVETGGVSAWMMVAQKAEYARPKRDQGGNWVGGVMTVQLKSPEWLVDELDLEMGDAEMRLESVEDEWVRDPVIRLGDRRVEDSYIIWDGDPRDVDVGVVVSNSVWEMRERAASSASSLLERQSSLSRVVLADVVVSYVASDSVGGVWDRYVTETDESSLSGFLGWLSAREFRTVLEGQGGGLFPEYAELLEVSQRTAKDTLEGLRYFRYEG